LANPCSIVYIVLIYLLFPETKGRTLEEIGSLFGDTHIASHWYGLSEAEKEKLHEEALTLTETGGIGALPPKKVDVDEVKAGSTDQKESLRED
jgi:hypothetical protein